MTSAQINDLKNLDEELAKDNLRGLWAREESVRREPAPFGKPILWKWAAIRAGLDAAGRLIATNYKGARRAISLIHPNMNVAPPVTGLRYSRQRPSNGLALSASISASAHRVAVHL